MADKTSMGAVLQFARDIDQKHEQGHGRLRGDLDRAEQRVSSIETSSRALELRLLTLESATKAPIDIGQIVFNPKMVLAIIGLVVSIVTGNWLTNQPIREQLVRGEERSKSVEEKVDNLQRQMEMRRLEIQQLSNEFQREGRRK